MSSRRRFLALASAALVLASVCIGTEGNAGGGLVLVVNAGNASNPSADEAKKLFLGEVTFWPGNVPVRPILRPSDSAAASAFYRTIGVAPARLKRIWQEKQLSGQGTAPETVAAPGALAAKVAGDPGAVGFATIDELPAAPAGTRFVPLN